MSMVLSFFASWWFLIVALLAVFSDAFVPFVPSATIVVAAALESNENHLPLPFVGCGVAAASFAADLVLLNVARRGAGRARRWIARRAGTADAAASVLEALEQKPGRTVVVARFVPGGRSVLDLAAGTAERPPARFVQWSAVSAVVWATYIIAMGWLNEDAFRTAWLSVAVSFLATTTVSAFVARHVTRHRARARAAGVAAAAEEDAALAEAA
ncbi:membrane protein DedA with SNARE-associated domain [Streptacidiphilus sp. BW17]